MNRSPRTLAASVALLLVVLVITTTAVSAQNATCAVRNCETCSSDSPVICRVCAPNYKLTPTDLCEMECRVIDCEVCYDDDNTKCATCIRGYWRNSQYLCVRLINGGAGSASLWLTAGVALLASAAALY